LGAYNASLIWDPEIHSLHNLGGYSLGGYSLGAYNLGAYSLGACNNSTHRFEIPTSFHLFESPITALGTNSLGTWSLPYSNSTHRSGIRNVGIPI